LDVGGGWTTDVRAFVPIEPQPIEVDERRLAGIGANPGHIEILYSKDDPSASMSRSQPGDQEGPRVSQVESARR
jgi:hypothetical protein